jgi:hypothetical protein
MKRYLCRGCRQVFTDIRSGLCQRCDDLATRLDGHGQRARACIDRSRVARRRADDLEKTARQELVAAQKLCTENGASFKHWCRRHTGLTYREARNLGWRAVRQGPAD